MVISKLDAAHSQLRVAIRMYFADDDLASIHTLTCAAREIYEKHCKKAGIDRFFDRIQADHPKLTEKEIWNAFNVVRNFLKHPDVNCDPNSTVELSDRINKLMLFCTCCDCDSLCTDQTPLYVQRYIEWFIATEPGLDDDCAIALELRYPSICSMSIDEQRAIGCQFVDDNYLGKFN